MDLCSPHDGSLGLRRNRGGFGVGGSVRARPSRAFVGRQHQLDLLAEALESARAGAPRVALVQGEAGIGKSSLIFEFLGSQHELRYIAASGEVAEAVLPYGIVQQLASSAVAALPGVLAGLSLLERGPSAEADPLAVGVELLALFSSLQQGAAVVVVVEDVQWADLLSAKALLFACRRLAADRVLVVLSCRPERTWQLGEGWGRFVSGDLRASEMTLTGLSLDELGALCRALGRTALTERAVRSLADYTGGNPLYVRAMLAGLSDDALQQVGRSLPAPLLLAGLVLPRVAALSRPARDLVVAAAVLGDGCSLADAAGVAGVEDATLALDLAQRAGLLTEGSRPSGRTVSFAHLLIRDAVYYEIDAQRRRDLHVRAASIMGGAEALAHRVAAAVGPDPELAADLRAAADTAITAGKVPLGAQYLGQAAAATEPGPERGHLALSAFELLVRSGDVAAAELARPAIERLPAGARRDTALGQLALLAARPWDADVLLRAAWASEQDGASSGEAALCLGQLLGISGSFAEGCAWLERALSSGTRADEWYDAARCIRSFAFSLAGDTGQALRLLDDLPAQAAAVPVRRTDALTYRGIARLCAGDVGAATEDLALAVHRIRGGLKVRFPGPPLAFLVEAEFRCGQWDDAQTHAEVGVTLARDADRDLDLAFVHGVAVPVAACRGDWDKAAAHVESAERSARLFGGLASTFAASARAILGFARDEPEEALRGAALALAVPEIEMYDCPAALWWRPAQIWGLIRIGEIDEAEAVLEVFAAKTTMRGDQGSALMASWLRGTLAMSRGDLEQADETFQIGRRMARGVMLPFHRAIIDLQHGRCLARLHRRASAVEAVRAAHDAFAGLRAVPFAQAADSELVSLGLRPRHGDDPGLPGLTSQELRVARLAARGMSNREIAAELYLSPKTVEYHLANAFAKLGVRSRHRLAAMLRSEASPRGES
jgi:DNA-binding CsgD family transcriptional regulator